MSPEPQEPFAKSISGLGDCKESPRLGDHTDKKKVLERVLVGETPGLQNYHWGSVIAAPGGPQKAVCLSRGRFRVRVEGWVNDHVDAHEGWEYVDLEQCRERAVEIAVWETSPNGPRVTPAGPVPDNSGHEHTYFIDYVGPLTGGTSRTAGPFG